MSQEKKLDLRRKVIEKLKSFFKKGFSQTPTYSKSGDYIVTRKVNRFGETEITYTKNVENLP